MWKLNNKGSTLITAMIAVMLLAVSSAGFMVAITGISNRALTIREEKQVYLSARSVAQAVAIKLVDDSYGQIMNLSVSERNTMSTLPDAMRLAPMIPLNLSRVQTELIKDVGAMTLNQVIDIGPVSWNDGGADLDMGDVNVTIIKTDVDMYTVEAAAKWKNEDMVVKTSIKSSYHPTSTGPEVLPEDQENWNGAYSDYGYKVDGVLEVDDTSTIIGSGIISTQISKDGVYHSLGDIVLEDAFRENGTLVSDKMIYLEDVELKSHKLYAKNEIVVLSDSEIKGHIHTKDLNILGDDINISQSLDTDKIIAKDITIKGSNIVVHIPVECETLDVQGDNITFTTTVKANSVNVSGENIVVNYEQEQVISYQEYDMEMAIRHKPDWANYEASQIKLFNTTIDNGTTDMSVDKIGPGYYWIAEDVNPVVITNSIYEGGAYVDREENYVSLDIQSYLDGGLSATNPAVIIVRDGQNLLIEQVITSDYVYILLEGNARVRLPEGESTVRIYGTQPSSSLQNEIDTKINQVLVDIFVNNWRDLSGVDVEGLQDQVELVLAEYEGQLNRIECISNVTIKGTFTVPYVKIEGNLIWEPVPYENVSIASSGNVARIPGVYTGQGYYLYEYQGYVK